MDLSLTIGENLGALRRERGLSLGQLAELSGISKMMLSQIERGKTNPTINTIWKIANGLKVPYTALIDAPAKDVRQVTLAEAMRNVQTEAEGRYIVYCYYPGTARRNFELFGVIFKPGCAYASPGHPERSQEYILLQSGSLSVIAGGTTYVLQPGDALNFAADQGHEYRNDGPEEVRAMIINHYSL